MVITGIHGMLNAFHFKSLGALNQWNVFWSCGGLLVVILALTLGVDERQSFEWVFTDYENRTGFDNPIYVFVLGLIGASYSMFGNMSNPIFYSCGDKRHPYHHHADLKVYYKCVGAEGAAYANEETKDADLSAPM